MSRSRSRINVLFSSTCYHAPRNTSRGFAIFFLDHSCSYVLFCLISCTSVLYRVYLIVSLCGWIRWRNISLFVTKATHWSAIRTHISLAISKKNVLSNTDYHFERLVPLSSNQLFKRRERNSSSCVCVLHKTSHKEISRRVQSRQRNCTKKAWSRCKVGVLFIKQITFWTFSSRSPSSLLKLSGLLTQFGETLW